MAPRDLMSSAAMDTVFGNLGLDRDDVGGGNGNDSTFADFENDADGTDDLAGDDVGIDDFADDGADDDPFAIDDGFEPERVTHTPRDRNRQQQQPRQQARGQQQQQRLRPDAKGNLVDAQGKVVVRAGTERRYYEGRVKAQKDLGVRDAQLRHTAGRLNSVTTIAQRMKTELDGYKAQAKALTDLGMSQDDQISAMNLYRQMMKNPKETLTRLLTRAAANGITVDGSGNSQQQPNVPGQIADVVKELLDGKLKPIEEFVTSQRTAQQQQTEDNALRQRTQQEVGHWFETNPDAGPYAQVILKVLRNPSFQGMSLDHVWDRIQLNLIRQRQNGNGRQRPASRNGNGFTPRRGSPPIGRRAPPSGNSGMAAVSTSYDTILNDVLDAHGIQ